MSIASVDEISAAVVERAQLQADGYTGRAKAVVDVDSSTLVGFTMVGSPVARRSRLSDRQ